MPQIDDALAEHDTARGAVGQISGFRTHAVGIYTHVLDQHGIAYNPPIVLNERQAGVAIEGVIRHNGTRDDGGLLRLSVDTHERGDGGGTPAWL